jgi:phage tail-like protein
MDVNGLHFTLLADAAHWRTLRRTRYDPACRALGLASVRELDAPIDAAAFAGANSALEVTPRALDALGSVARWDAAAAAIVVHSVLPADVVTLPLPERPTDLCVGHDGVLYVALAGAVLMHDLRGRFATTRVDTLASPPGAGFVPWRLAAIPPHAGGCLQDEGGVWIIERASGRIARLTGRPAPLLSPQPDDYAPGVFRPEPEHCRAPRLDVLPGIVWPAGERPLAIDVHAAGGLLLLSWGVDGAARVRRLIGAIDTGADDSRPAALSAPLPLAGARYAYAVAWLDATHIALRMPGRRDAPAFELPAAERGDAARPEAAAVPASGTIYPLAADAVEAPFVHQLDDALRYPAGPAGAEPLLPLSLNTLARHGEAWHWRDGGDAGAPDAPPPDAPPLDAHLLDSGHSATVWHRLMAEASIPRGSGFIVWVAATAEPEPPPLDAAEAWHAHGFGQEIAALAPAAMAGPVPSAAWERAPSELAGHPGLAAWSPERHRRGLFGVLLQDARPRVRRIVGRYLWLRVECFGDGRAGPEIAALRAWAGRFDYVEQYLPRVYRETLFGAAAQAAGPASPADFLSRLLANVEGVLTTLEDRVAAAHLVTHPATVPEPQLDWLASWIGVAFDPVLPAARRRAWLADAPRLARWHGTRRGLALALDIATGGGVRGGEIVVLEDFRLRRLLATLIGVDLADENDPLLPGLHRSGNSIVGDTLVVGESERVELLALFRDEVSNDPAERDAVLAFLGRLAHRATVLVHSEVEPQDLGLIRRIAELESPAHVQVRVLNASWPLLVGVASLVGVDTYLGPPRSPRAARVSVSALGMGDRVLQSVSLDPRLAGHAAPPLPPPAAIGNAAAGADRTVAFGRSFELDGSGSTAAPGRNLERYIWRRLPPLA